MPGSAALKIQALPLIHNPNFDKLMNLALNSVYIRIAILGIRNDEDDETLTQEDSMRA